MEHKILTARAVTSYNRRCAKRRQPTRQVFRRRLPAQTTSPYRDRIAGLGVRDGHEAGRGECPRSHNPVLRDLDSDCS
jgi:hypothetical protein